MQGLCVAEVQLYSSLAFFVIVLLITIISNVAIHLTLLSLSFWIALGHAVS